MKLLTRAAGIVLSIALVVNVSGCGGGFLRTQPPLHVSDWTWVSGSNTLGQFAQQGVALHTLRVEGTL
jgi:hypothetical protein